MRYKLIDGANKGVIIDGTPVMLDMRETFEISFLLPNDGTYIALFCGEDNIEYKAIIHNGKVAIPKELLKQGKEQQVGLTVCQIDDEKILRAWECWPLRISAFLFMRQSQWQVTVGITDQAFFDRFAELEHSHAKLIAEFENLSAQVNANSDGIKELAHEEELL